MAQEQSSSRLSQKCQGAVLGRKPYRLGDARHFGARDFHPMQHQGRIAEAGADKCSGASGAGIAANRSHPIAPGWGPIAMGAIGLFVLRGLGHGPIMPASRIPAKLLAWYDIHRRVLPWRAPAGKRGDPYRIWLSEIMLQQTTVQAVAAYYRKFLVRWPDVKALARAKEDDVLAAWAGLGYYARARNLHAAARIVTREMGGKFPLTAEGLRALPGIGDYTAGAISAIAYDEKQAAMDANAERVIARLYAVTTPMPKAKIELHRHGQALVPDRAGDFAQGLMDLGSAICTPRKPACLVCPLTDDCAARKRGIQETLPVKAPKMARPLRRGAAFVVRDRTGAVLLVKRPDKGLLASMLQPPLGPWGEKFPSARAALAQAPFAANWKKRVGLVRHGFTHFELEVEVYTADVGKRPKIKGKWIALDKLKDAALPTVMRKIIALGLSL
jgi:A/G-specific adenine glycosylase